MIHDDQLSYPLQPEKLLSANGILGATPILDAYQRHSMKRLKIMNHDDHDSHCPRMSSSPTSMHSTNQHHTSSYHIHPSIAPVEKTSSNSMPMWPISMCIFPP